MILGKELRHGLELETQNKISLEMELTVTNMRVLTAKGNKKALLPFQKGILMSIKSLRMLFEDMKDRYGISFIITNRLKQDILDNFFTSACNIFIDIIFA